MPEFKSCYPFLPCLAKALGGTQSTFKVYKQPSAPWKKNAHENSSRPGRQKRENKEKTIPLCVTQRQFVTTKSKAKPADLSVSEYLRKLATGHPVQARFDKDEKRNLQGIRTNLNQLAAFTKKRYFYQKPEELKRILKK